MPATRFFKLLESGRRLTEQSKAKDFVAQCDIQTIALADSEYYQSIRKRFYYQAIGREDLLKTDRALDPTDQATKIAVKGLFDTAAKLHG